MIPLLVIALSANVTAGECEKGRQPYKNYCISNDMADMIACIDSSGGNKQQFDLYLDESVGNSSKNAGKVAGGNKVVEGSAQLSVNHDTERRVVNALGEKYFAGALQACSSLAARIVGKSKKAVAPPPPRSSALPKLPIALIASGDTVTFFNGFSVGIHGIYGIVDDVLNVELLTPENGMVFLKTNNVPENITRKGINYSISAMKNEHGQVILKLDKYVQPRES